MPAHLPPRFPRNVRRAPRLARAIDVHRQVRLRHGHELGGAADAAVSVRRMATAAGVSRGKIRYWIEKAADPNFHPGVHGGFRGTPRLPAVVRCFLENLVFLLLEEAPSLRLPQLTV